MLSLLIFYLVIVVGVLQGLGNKSIYAFCIYQLYYFINPESRWWGVNIINIPYSMLFVFLMAFNVLRNYRVLNGNSILKAKPLLWMYVVGVLYWIATVYAVFPEEHKLYLGYFIKLIVIVTIAYKLIDTEKDFDTVLWAYIIGSSYVSFYVYQIGRNSGGRVESIGLIDSPDANGLAAAIAPSLILSIYFIWSDESRVRKLMASFSSLLILNALILINSRGAFLGVLVGVVVFYSHLMFSSVDYNKRKLFSLVSFILGLCALFILADESFISRFSSIAKEANVDVNASQSGGTRVFFWKAAWEMAKDYPWGNGYRGFNYYSSQYIQAGVDTGGSSSRSVHSTWFEVLSEIGYLGLFCFIIMLGISFYCIRVSMMAVKRENKFDTYYKLVCVLSAFITYIVAMTFLNRMRAEILYWFVLFSASSYNLFCLKSGLTSRSEVVSGYK